MPSRRTLFVLLFLFSSVTSQGVYTCNIVCGAPSSDRGEFFYLTNPRPVEEKGRFQADVYDNSKSKTDKNAIVNYAEKEIEEGSGAPIEFDISTADFSEYSSQMRRFNETSFWELQQNETQIFSFPIPAHVTSPQHKWWVDEEDGYAFGLFDQRKSADDTALLVGFKVSLENGQAEDSFIYEGYQTIAPVCFDAVVEFYPELKLTAIRDHPCCDHDTCTSFFRGLHWVALFSSANHYIDPRDSTLVSLEGNPKAPAAVQTVNYQKATSLFSGETWQVDPEKIPGNEDYLFWIIVGVIGGVILIVGIVILIVVGFRKRQD